MEIEGEPLARPSHKIFLVSNPKNHLKIAKNGILNYAKKVLMYCISYLVSSRKFWSRDKKGETVSSRLMTFVSLPAVVVMLTSQESTRLGVDSRPIFSDPTRLDS